MNPEWILPIIATGLLGYIASGIRFVVMELRNLRISFEKHVVEDKEAQKRIDALEATVYHRRLTDRSH